MRNAIFVAILLAGSLARAEEGVCPASHLDLSGVTDPAIRQDLASFDPAEPVATFRWEAREVPARPGGTCLEVRFPSPLPSGIAENDVVWCRYYAPRGLAPGERAPAALVLHHLGGDFGIEATLADYLAKTGVAALEVEFPFYGPRKPKDASKLPKRLFDGDPEAGLQATRQAVADVRRAADWLLSRPDVDPARLGSVGISLGGILGSIVAGVDPRFRRNVLAIAGGDLPAILLHDSNETKKMRQLFQERGIGRPELEGFLRPIEPLRYASRIHTRGLLMVNAKRDEVIPRAATDALWHAAGEPEIVWYDTGHATIAAFLLDLFGHVRDWFLAPAEAAVPAAAPAPPRRASF